MSQQTSPRSGLDATLVNAVVRATTEVMQTMANSNCEFKGIQAEAEYKARGDISAVIGILGDKGEGMVALSFTLALANQVVSQLLGVKPENLSSDDRCDGIGELVNMISGNAKAQLAKESEGTYKLSLPTVIQGKDHEISSRPRNNPYLVVMFESDGAPFHLQVSFKSK